jgi:CheY-like chemotaxis protein
MLAVIIGKYQDHQKRQMRDSAQRASSQCLFLGTVDKAINILRSLDETPRCIFASIGSDIAGLVDFLRDHVEFYSVPVIALTASPSSEAYRQANQLGADDSIPEYDMGGLTRRLANLSQGEAPRLPRMEAGRAIVAVSDARRRKTVGRKLRAAGYEVDFVAGEDELRQKSQGIAPPALVVTSPSFRPDAFKNSVATSGEFEVPEVKLPALGAESSLGQELTEPEVAGRLMFMVEELTRGSFKDARDTTMRSS